MNWRRLLLGVCLLTVLSLGWAGLFTQTGKGDSGSGAP